MKGKIVTAYWRFTCRNYWMQNIAYQEPSLHGTFCLMKSAGLWWEVCPILVYRVYYVNSAHHTAQSASAHWQNKQTGTREKNTLWLAYFCKERSACFFDIVWMEGCSLPVSVKILLYTRPLKLNQPEFFFKSFKWDVDCPPTPPCFLWLAHISAVHPWWLFWTYQDSAVHTPNLRMNIKSCHPWQVAYCKD